MTGGFLALVAGLGVAAFVWLKLQGALLQGVAETTALKLDTNFPEIGDRPLVAAWVDLAADPVAWREFWSRAGLLWITGEESEAPELVGLVAGRFGPVASLRMVPGQDLGDWQKSAGRMASMLGVSTLAVSEETPGVVDVAGVLRDPLAQTSSAAAPTGLVSASTPIPIGRTSHGDRLELDLASRAGHIVMQGQTRSGKSALTYLILSWAVHMPDVQVCGFDHTQILLGPLGDLPGDRALGADMTRHLEVMEALLREMDSRITGLAGAGRDKLDVFSQSQPLLLIVCEEWPGLIRSADAHDKATGVKPADRIAPKLEAGLGRLVSEGAKAGLRVLLIAQRASTKVVEGDSRSNFGTAISLRTDTEGVGMLHRGADKELAARATRFSDGRGLFESPWEALTEWQADYLGGYDQYIAQIRHAQSMTQGEQQHV